MAKKGTTKPDTQGRGQLTQRIIDEAFPLLGRVITQTELRLMPYIQHVMVNKQKLDPEKINSEERKIIAKWKEAGHIDGGILGLTITQDFWHIINRLIWLGYVDITKD